MQSYILIVDDERPVLDAIRRMLNTQRGRWVASCVDSGEAAWQRMLVRQYDVVLCDINMRGLKGLDLLRRIQRVERTKLTPVIMLTGLADHTLKRQALELGASDLLSKPVEPEDLLARLGSATRLKAYQDELRASNEKLERSIQQGKEELFRARREIIWRLAKVAEQRGMEPDNHAIRVSCYSRLIGRAMGQNRGFVETLFLAAALHDIGKIAMPDSILRTRKRPGSGQAARLRSHCEIGAGMLRADSRMKRAYEAWRGVDSRSVVNEGDNPVLEMAATIALSHHEKWDGSGYPRKLAGEAIPLEARIVAIADTFDVLTSARPDQDAYGEDRALQIIQDAVGSHFDPNVHEAFREGLPEIRLARERFTDNSQSGMLSEWELPEEALGK